MRALVVEDEAALRDGLREQLAKQGFTVDVAADVEEGLARMQALMRRAGGWASPILECGPIRLDTRAQQVSLNGSPIELTTFEYRILEHMMLRAGDVISKTELTERLYDQDYERDSNVIEVFIGRLRRKLDPDESLKPIETLRGRGYRFSIARNQGT